MPLILIFLYTHEGRALTHEVGERVVGERLLTINDKQNENRSKLLTSLSLSVRWRDVNLSD
jgi:hypothetical protein